ncbi:conserved hypothetical protein, membrane, partial [Candidatus Magnetomorum sp. HK-1]
MKKKSFKRNMLFNMNRFQATLVLPILLIMIVVQILLGGMFYLSVSKTSMVLEQSNSKTVVYQQLLIKYQAYFPFVITSISLLVFLLVYWILYISNKILGPHERIIRELDEMIAGKKEKKPLTTRPNDQMFEELLPRINVLIENCSLEKKDD